MQLPLETWYILRDVTDDGDVVRARFVPDHFHAEVVDPVLILTVHRPDDAADAKTKINRFREEFLVEIGVSAQRAELWAEYDDAAAMISGQSVTSQRAAYSPSDLLHIIRELTSHLDSSQSQVVDLLAKSHEVKSFVAELLHRAVAKKSLTTRSTTAIDAQIQVLERILGKLRDA